MTPIFEGFSQHPIFQHKMYYISRPISTSPSAFIQFCKTPGNTDPIGPIAMMLCFSVFQASFSMKMTFSQKCLFYRAIRGPRHLLTGHDGPQSLSNGDKLTLQNKCFQINPHLSFWSIFQVYFTSNFSRHAENHGILECP